MILSSWLAHIGRAILPADISLRRRRLELLVWSFILSLAYYPDGFGFVAWFALIRPLMIIAPLPGRAAFTSAYLYGFSFAAFCIYWVAIVTPPGTVGAVLLVGSYYAILLYVFNRLYQYKTSLAAFLFPFLWVGVEHYRTLTEFAFPWSDLGYTQAYYLYPMQIVSIVSVHGLSLIIVAVNVMLWQVMRKEVEPARRVTFALIPPFVIALLVAYGWAVVPPYPTSGDTKVAVLQGSMSPEEKWADEDEAGTFDIYGPLVEQLGDTTIDLIVWPETVLPCYLTRDRNCLSNLREIVAKSGTYHLVGSLSARRIGGELRHFNSCYQLDPNGTVGQMQEKVKLVPFSEQVPYQNQLSFLRPKAIREYLSFIETYDVQWWSDFYPGDSAVLFETEKTVYGTLICFESTFPDYSRQLILKGAKFLVGITNDSWFGTSVGIHQHARIFITRAIENRCWGVRAANSGLSFVVDDYGRIREAIAVTEVGSLIADIEEVERFSLFTRFGDWAGRGSFLILWLTIVILSLSWMKRKLFGPH